MRWRKLGRVFVPSGEMPWMRTHAAVPIPLHLGGDRYRIYFTVRDDRNRSHLAWLHIDLRRPNIVQELAPEPALGPGALGCFDDAGVYGNALVERDGQLLLYFIGWNRGPREPLFYASIGLAASSDGGLTFERVSRAPILARSEFDPCFVSSPFVLIDDGRWRMWYVSGTRWAEADGTLRSYYHVKYAESADGLAWTRDGRVCIDNAPGEPNIARPFVRRRREGYEMWYSFDRGAGYRIGYAESVDGYVWTRRDELAGIDVSETGWDSAMIAYPYAFRHGTTDFLLYSGNDFGREGFGLAVRDGTS